MIRGSPVLVVFLLLVSQVILGACSHRGVYENLRLHQRNECLKELPARQQECLERASKSYEAYQLERRQAVEQDL